MPLTRNAVRGIAHLGATILRTTNRGNPFYYPVRRPDDTFVSTDRSDELLERARSLGIEALITIGGPKTITMTWQELCACSVSIPR